MPDNKTAALELEAKTHNNSVWMNGFAVRILSQVIESKTSE